jgi:hypothetical protein
MRSTKNSNDIKKDYLKLETLKKEVIEYYFFNSNFSSVWLYNSWSSYPIFENNGQELSTVFKKNLPTLIKTNLKRKSCS